jgi:hypothetical protein
MTFRTVTGLASVAILAIQGSSVYARQDALGTLPHGRPFQILQQSIANIDAALQAQIADLQAQLKVNAANDAVQTQLIGALQAAVGQLELRMSGVQASIDQLNAYNALQDTLLQQQLSRINQMQSQLDSQADVIGSVVAINTQLTKLFALFNLQQSVLSTIQGQIGILSNQTNVNHQQILNLSTLLSTLNAQFMTTRTWLATGCPQGSSIRQVSLGGGVACELDTTTASSLQFSASMMTIMPGGLGTSDVSCPPSFPNEVWIATGGGFSVTPGAQVLNSGKTANGWRVAIFNPSPMPVQGGATVTCAASR